MSAIERDCRPSCSVRATRSTNTLCHNGGGTVVPALVASRLYCSTAWRSSSRTTGSRARRPARRRAASTCAPTGTRTGSGGSRDRSPPGGRTAGRSTSRTPARRRHSPGRGTRPTPPRGRRRVDLVAPAQALDHDRCTGAATDLDQVVLVGVVEPADRAERQERHRCRGRSGRARRRGPAPRRVRRAATAPAESSRSRCVERGRRRQPGGTGLHRLGEHPAHLVDLGRCGRPCRCRRRPSPSGAGWSGRRSSRSSRRDSRRGWRGTPRTSRTGPGDGRHGDRVRVLDPGEDPWMNSRSSRLDRRDGEPAVATEHGRDPVEARDGGVRVERRSAGRGACASTMPGATMAPAASTSVVAGGTPR